MGLQNHLSDVSSESIPTLFITFIVNCVCYLKSLIFAIFHNLSIHLHQIDNSQHAHDVIGSRLADMAFLAEQLKLNRVFSHSYRDKGGPNSTCVVCLNYFGEGDHVRKLACRHVFHKGCFDGRLSHLNFNCPLCKASLVAEERVELTRRRIGEDGITWFCMR